jgi:glycine/D-amino acid oxidase-like deaminating enzyme
VSFEHLSEVMNNPRAKVLADTLDAGTSKYLSENKEPARKVGELDNRGSHFYLALYWAEALAAQSTDAELGALHPVFKALSDNEATIVAELTAVQGKPVDVGGYYSPIDVAALHQAFTVGARRAGATIERSWRLETAERSVLEGDASSNGTFERQAGGGWADRWLLGADDGRTLTARLVVNAAGAWGDVVAGICGVAGVGLQPRRRTAFMTPSTFDGSSAWPMVVDVAHRWYAKPDGTQFLCSPADETLSPPCDSKPEELDVALAIDLINQATTLGIRTVSSAWAGLRTFAPDESMVIGPDPEVPSFVWCVGQGGTGIQTAPAAGRLLADLTLDGAPSPFFDPRPETNLAVLDLAALTPERLVRRPVVTA